MDGVPAHLMDRMRALYGAAGAAWLDGLPALLAAAADRWGVTLTRPFPNLTYNIVVPGRLADGTPVVLKAGVPNDDLLNEIRALRHYAGRGAVRLLAADAAAGLFLLQRLRPGVSLRSLADDDQATRIAAGVMRRLWRPVGENGRFPTVGAWAAGLQRLRDTFEGGTGPFDARLVETAEGLFAELLPSMAAPVLLHGDLHHDNILAAADGWLAIDPKGVVGEPAYEVGALLRNFWGRDTDAGVRRRLSARRVAILAAALDCDARRIAGWGVAQAVLSAWWHYEDGDGGWDGSMAAAAALRPLL